MITNVTPSRAVDMETILETDKKTVSNLDTRVALWWIGGGGDFDVFGRPRI